MILGIDYGIKRIGLAIVDETVGVVLPYKLLENKGLEYIMEEFRKIVKQEDITKIVVGMPLTLKGEFGPKAEEIKIFIEQLQKEVEVPVVFIDERFSSRLADTLGGENGKNRDIGAAMIILENYILHESAVKAGK